MKLKVEKVVQGGKNEEIKRMYLSSFRKEQRLPFRLMVLLSKMKRTEFLSFYDDEKCVGFAYFGVEKKISFLRFLVVDETLQSKGYGGFILEEIEKMYPKNKWILAIEPSNDHSYSYTQRAKRKKFYLNHGYQNTGYYMKLGKCKQEILIKNGEFDKSEFLLFFMKYSYFMMFPRVWISKE